MDLMKIFFHKMKQFIIIQSPNHAIVFFFPFLAAFVVFGKVLSPLSQIVIARVVFSILSLSGEDFIVPDS